MRIERATSADIDVIAALNEAIHARHRELAPSYFRLYSRDNVVVALREFFAEPETCAVLAWEGPKPIGYCLLKVIEREPNAWTEGFRRLLVDQISVEPNAQRQGIGTLLMQEACQFAREHHINEVTLEYWANNDAARAFYQALGFEPLTEKVWLKIHDNVEH